MNKVQATCIQDFIPIHFIKFWLVLRTKKNIASLSPFVFAIIQFQ